VKILVLPCGMQIGGSEINAIDLAAEVQRCGHEAVVLGPPGPMAEIARRKQVRVLTATASPRLRPSPSIAAEIRAVVMRERPDIVHAYESYTCTEAYYGMGLRRRVPLVGTLYAMSVDRYVPLGFPMIAGTAELHRQLLETRPREAVFRLDPPVDVTANTPDGESGLRFRAEWGVGPDEIALVLVSRLDVWLKLDSLLDAVDAVDQLAAAGRPVHLLIVGDGPARETVQRRAEAVNGRHGRRVVTLVGAVLDPVPAYRAADVVIGMGTSLLRGLAVGKPAVVVGELGYVQPLTPDSITTFLEQGFWGVGDGSRGAARLRAAVESIIDATSEHRDFLGKFGRQLVVNRFGLETSTAQLLDIYEAALRWSPSPARLLSDNLRTPVRVIHRKLHDRMPAKRRARQRLLQSTSNMDRFQPTLATRKPRSQTS
jgi:L-malate glycosyltransferase